MNLYTKNELFCSNTQKIYDNKAEEARFYLGGIGTGIFVWAHVDNLQTGSCLISLDLIIFCRILFLRLEQNLKAVHRPRFLKQTQSSFF